MEKLNKADIQGLVARGYKELRHARFVLLEVVDAVSARAYLGKLVDQVTRAETSKPAFALHVAFTWPGLVKLEVPASGLDSFAREFKEGMDDDVRAVAIGDQGVNDPAKWAWGTRQRTPVHVLILIYADDEPTLDTWVADERQKFEPGALRVVLEQTTTRSREDQKEHFGWRDGIATPIIEGLGWKPPESWTFPIRAGEFILGYPNEYEDYTESPTVDLAADPDHVLPPTRDGAARDLGANGSYLVYRQIRQEVLKLWTYLADSAEPGDTEVAKATALGAKMVGRWPSGASLVSVPDGDVCGLEEENDFTYHDVDHAGTSCPLGAHIRRANPRDQLPSDHDRKDSVEMVRKHQMIRRGRAFGAPIVEDLDPAEILKLRGQPDDEVRGLHFICLVSHIGRQFEFVQRAWINSPNFAALAKDGDPIIGVHRPDTDPNPSDQFTCPASPLRRKYRAMPQFTSMLGGAYFFLPGIRALRFILRAP